MHPPGPRSKTAGRRARRPGWRLIALLPALLAALSALVTAAAAPKGPPYALEQQRLSEEETLLRLRERVEEVDCRRLRPLPVEARYPPGR
jgi:hypothetical protein